MIDLLNILLNNIENTSAEEITHINNEISNILFSVIISFLFFSLYTLRIISLIPIKLYSLILTVYIVSTTDESLHQFISLYQTNQTIRHSIPPVIDTEVQAYG